MLREEMMRARTVWSLGGIAALLVVDAAALSSAVPVSKAAPDGKPKAVLVELFTSEGCSSCPPADALLRQVNGTRMSGDQLVVGISEHVTYWNQLGWSDPYSAAIYTERQNAYGGRFNLDSVYTPQMVVNGAEQFVGNDASHLRSAVKRQLDQPETVAVRILATKIDGVTVTVDFSAAGEASVKAADILAVIVDDVDQTSVPRGENSGRTLSHVAVARSLTRVATLKTTPEQTVTLTLPASFKASQAHHLIIFAQTPGNGRVLGVDTKPL
jgi:hypothetical protein